MFLFEHGTGTVTGNGEPEQVAGLRVTTNFGDFFGSSQSWGGRFVWKKQPAVTTLQFWGMATGNAALVPIQRRPGAA